MRLMHAVICFSIAMIHTGQQSNHQRLSCHTTTNPTLFLDLGTVTLIKEARASHVRLLALLKVSRLSQSLCALPYMMYQAMSEDQADVAA